MPDYIIAIDPGVSGSAVVIDPVTREIEDIHIFESMFSLQAFALDWSRVSRNVAIVMEKVHGTPIQGSKQISSMMKNVGHWEAMMYAHFPRAPFHLVTPQEWQRNMGLKAGDYAGRKRELKTIARDRYPDGRVTLATADALLIADYAAKHWPVGKLL
jgi:hypothetical protein